MARGLKVTDWVERLDNDGVSIAKGFITKNLGNGFWEVHFVDQNLPMNFIDTVRSNVLVKLECELNKNQVKVRDELFKDLAIDTKDWKWLKELTGVST